MGNAAGLATVPISIQEKIKSLVTIIDTTTGSTRSDALDSLFKFQTHEVTCHYVPFLLHPDLQLIPIMKRILESLVNDYVDIKTIKGVLCVLNPFAAKVETATLICSSEAKFLPVLVKLYYRKDIFHFVDVSVITMSSFRECHDYLLSDEVGYISYLKHNLAQEPPDPIVFDQIEQVTRTMVLHNIKRLFDAGLLGLVLQQFLITNTENLSKNNIEIRKMWSRCLLSLTRTSKLNEAAKYYRDNIPNGEQEIFKGFPEKETLVHIYGIILLSNLYGKDEASPGTTNTEMNSILDRYPRALYLFALLLQVNMDSPKIIPKELEEIHFMYGAILIGDIAIVLKNLSVSDQNKRRLLDHADLLQSVGRAIQLFIDDAPACCRLGGGGIMYYTDGGGKDFVTIENLLEFLFQLSFFYETDESFKTNFILPGYNLVEQLTAIVALPQERNLPFEAKRSALALLNRFRGGENVENKPDEVNKNSVAAGPIGPSSSSAATETAIPPELNGYSPRHLMISYSWAVKKDHVIALSNILKEKFHCDVWRDEEGSAILPAMSGDIMEMMAEAVQKSYAVIIVVSPEYKESPNCRLEARYARAREVNGLLKIIYVMIDSKYHTRSSPRLVDGWLGAMVGSELWYPLWDSNQIEMTAKNIAERVGVNADLNKNRLFMSTQQPSSANTATPQPTAASSYVGVNPSVSPAPTRQGPDYQKAWTFLDDPKNSKFTKNPDGLIELLDDLGVYKAEDLTALNPEHLESIAVLLKIAPGNQFREALLLKH